MNFMKWKKFIITSLVTLSPILLGLALWDKLPSEIAIHFDINNNPDNFAPKAFVVFILPLLMVLLQFICCLINDINAKKHGERKKFETVTKWIIPVMCVILQAMTFAYALERIVEIRIPVILIVGAILIVIGNYLPKLDYVKNHDVDTEKARKINRFLGFETVIMGLLFIISVFLPPVASLICVFLLIPYAIIGVAVGIKIGLKK